MLTAAQARKISRNAADKDITEVEAKRYVKGILVGIKKDAEQGYCQHTLDLTDYSKNMRMPIVHILENLGYKARPHTWLGDMYVIHW